MELQWHWECFSVAFETDSQQKYENELLQLREKLSDQDTNDSCHSSAIQNDPTSSLEDSPENGAHDSETEQKLKSGGQLENTEHRFHEILNRELSVFCEKMCSSRTGDVSNEQETNDRHDVAEVYESNSEKSDVNGEKDSNETGDNASTVDNVLKLGGREFLNEVDNLKRKLAETFIPLLSSSEGKAINRIIITTT